MSKASAAPCPFGSDSPRPKLAEQFSHSGVLLDNSTCHSVIVARSTDLHGLASRLPINRGEIGPFTARGVPPERPQNAGIDGQNQYVAARNRLDRPRDTLVRIGRGQKFRKNSFESHRQFYSQGQRHRARRQALRGSDRREHPSRQGNSGQPDRNAPNRRRGEDFGTLQDHRPGREGDHRGPQLQLPL